MRHNLLDSMMASLKVAGKAPRTCTLYAACVHHFAKRLDVPLDMATRDDVAAFVTYIGQERRLSPSSVKIYIYSIRFFFEVTLRKPAIVEGLKAPRVSSKTVVVLSPDEVARFLGGFRLPIFFAIASLLFGTGMRLGEALAVTVDDIDAARGVITVRHTKTRRPRVVRLTPELLRRLRDYWRATRPTRPLLFPGTDPTRHLDSSAVQKVFKRVATEVGLGKRVTPHVLRHTYATHMLEAGVDIHTVQLLLGHATLYMTLRYLHLSTAHLAGRQTPLPPLLAG